MMAVVQPLWLACSLLCTATSGELLLGAWDERVGALKWLTAVAFVLWSALSVVLLVWESW